MIFAVFQADGKTSVSIEVFNMFIIIVIQNGITIGSIMILIP